MVGWFYLGMERVMSIKWFSGVILLFVLAVGCGGSMARRRFVHPAPKSEFILRAPGLVQPADAVFRARFHTVKALRAIGNDYSQRQFIISFRGETQVVTKPCSLTEAEFTITCSLPGIKASSRLVLREPGGRGLCGIGWVEFPGHQPIRLESQPEDKYGCVFLLPDAPP